MIIINTRPQPNPKAALFDWDNTLIDSWETNRIALNIVNKRFNRPELTLEEVKLRPQIGLRESFPAVYGDRWQEAEQFYYETYRKYHLDMLTPHNKAEEILSLLYKHNTYLAVVSNKSGVSLRKEVEHLNWSHYFQEIVGSTDTPSNKPHLAPILKALSKYQFDIGQNVWFIGDSAVDMQCAKEINATPIYIGPQDLINEIRTVNPDLFHYHNLGELLTTLENIINMRK